MSNIIELEAFRVRREVGMRRGKSIAGKIIAATIDNMQLTNSPNVIFPVIGGMSFEKMWVDESREIEARHHKDIAARQNHEVEIERQKHRELLDD